MARREKLRRSFEDLENSIEKLKESVSTVFEAQFKQEIVVEIVLKRFEYTYEALWKLLKEFLLEEGVEAVTPLQCFKEAYRIGLISEQQEEIFPLLVKKRNEAVHIYSADKASEIYFLIKNTFAPAMIKLFETLRERLVV